MKLKYIMKVRINNGHSDRERKEFIKRRQNWGDAVRDIKQAK